MSLDLDKDWNELLWRHRTGSWIYDRLKDTRQGKEFSISYELFEKNKRLFELGQIEKSELIASNENRMRAADIFYNSQIATVSRLSKEEFYEHIPNAGYFSVSWFSWKVKISQKLRLIPLTKEQILMIIFTFLIFGLSLFLIIWTV